MLSRVYSPIKELVAETWENLDNEDIHEFRVTEIEWAGNDMHREWDRWEMRSEYFLYSVVRNDHMK